MRPDHSKGVTRIRGRGGIALSSGPQDATFRALIENSTDGIVLFDADWNVFYASPTTKRILGYSPAELLTAETFSLIHPDDLDRVNICFRQCLASPGKTVQIVARIRHKDGSWRILEGIFTNLLNDPRVRGIVNNYRDITERIRSETALRESEEKFKRAFRSNPDAMSITTLDRGTYLDVNEAFLRLTGFTREELIGHVALETSWVDPQHRIRMVRCLQEQGHVKSMEVCFRKKGGEIFFANLSAELVEIGGSQCLLATSQDITERRRAAEELRRSEAEYRSLVELAPYGICRITRDGRILLVNSALVKMLKYDTAAEVLRLDFDTQVYEDPTERELILQRVQADPTSRIEAAWKRKDGSRIFVRLATRLIYDDQRNLQQTELFVEDLTEQRALEKQLQMVQKMEAIGQLAGGVAHDFNNVLMIIRSRAALLTDDASNPKNVLEQAEEIIRATRRAATSTRQLLAFSRNQVLEPVILDLNVLLADLANMLPYLIGKQIKTRILPGPNLRRVKVDRGQFEQVVVNLVINARDAMPAGGLLVIETSNVTLDGSATAPHPPIPPGHYILLSVADNGKGMDAQTQAHIFEPFFTTKEHGRGTGLGLAMVYGIIRQSGGHIVVDSMPGAGTTFRIYLPETLEAEQRGAREQLVPSPCGTETVLFVEDEEALRTIGADFLRSKGYDVLLAEDGIEALDICRTTNRAIQLLVTDLIMPRMGGADLAKQALALNPKLRILYISGHSGQAGGSKSLTHHKPILQKPFSMADLAIEVRAVLDLPDNTQLQQSS